MTIELKPVQARSSVDQVVERIRDVIEKQKLTAGSRLPGELQMVEQLQVSRPVLREALARLQGLGLIEIQRGNGTFVAKKENLSQCVQLLRSAISLAPRELLAYAELRAAVEVQAVRQAAERATVQDVANLHDILIDLDSLDRPYEELLEIDFRFHRQILAIAQNELMQNLMEVIYEFVVLQMTQTTPLPGDNELGRLHHREIFDAIKCHNPNNAEKIMRAHMEVVLNRLKGASDG